MFENTQEKPEKNYNLWYDIVGKNWIKAHEKEAKNGHWDILSDRASNEYWGKQHPADVKKYEQAMTMERLNKQWKKDARRQDKFLAKGFKF
jgi:hypothetical protein